MPLLAKSGSCICQNSKELYLKAVRQLLAQLESWVLWWIAESQDLGLSYTFCSISYEGTQPAVVIVCFPDTRSWHIPVALSFAGSDAVQEFTAPPCAEVSMLLHSGSSTIEGAPNTSVWVGHFFTQLHNDSVETQWGTFWSLTALLQHRPLLRTQLVLPKRLKRNKTWRAQLQEQVGAGCTPSLCNAPTSAFCPIQLLSVTFCSSPDILEMARAALLPTSLTFPAHAPAAGGRKTVLPASSTLVQVRHCLI